MNTQEIAKKIAQGSLSAREVLEDCISKIETADKHINAFTGTHYGRARAEADAVDASRRQGFALPPLAGIPYAVKNLFDIKGEVTLAGSKINRRHPPASQDAFLIEQMRRAGAVLVGALNMDEYAYGFTTENTHYGSTHNPHDLTKMAGGSSGGSAAAVAAGLLPLTLGSDTNGSIRVPASFCGVWGLKPTFGRLSRRGTYPFVHSIDHLGPFADSLEGLALCYDALQSPDPLDPGCHALSIQPISRSLALGIDGLRIGLLGGYFSEFSESAACEAVGIAASVLGAKQTVTWPDAALGRAAAFIMTSTEGSSLHLEDLRTHMDDFEPNIVDRFIAGAIQPAAWYLKANRFRRLYRSKINALFQNWDILLAPATPTEAPTLGTEWLSINGVQHPCKPSIGLLTQPISFAGCPVVAAPLWPSQAKGLPIGVQVIAAPWREDLAFRAAQVLQDAGVAHLKPSSV
jgi:amidase/aspartyl-tRNA(Asn)/glutamyl-tRNA(Gln) amidotransferase subunit A